MTPLVAWDRVTVPPLAVALIGEVEGFRNQAYRDSVGYWTIAFGSRTMPDGSPVRAGCIVTLAEAQALLTRQAHAWVLAIASHIKVAMNEGQAAALVSYVHNFGPGVLSNNTMVAMINGAAANLAASQFGGWVLAGGAKSLGLMRRRELERRIFLGGSMADYDAVWRLSFDALLPAYATAFADAKAWNLRNA